jgi:hypothetical protein
MLTLQRFPPKEANKMISEKFWLGTDNPVHEISCTLEKKKDVSVPNIGIPSE